MTFPFLACDRRAAAAIEFAIVAPLLLTTLFGIFEVGRALWQWQAIQEAAYGTARCVAVGDAGCDTVAKAQAHAVAQVTQSRIALRADAVSISTNQTCGGLGGMVQVDISLPYHTALSGFVPRIPSHLKARACMPRT